MSRDETQQECQLARHSPSLFRQTTRNGRCLVGRAYSSTPQRCALSDLTNIRFHFKRAILNILAAEATREDATTRLHPNISRERVHWDYRRNLHIGDQLQVQHPTFPVRCSAVAFVSGLKLSYRPTPVFQRRSCRFGLACAAQVSLMPTMNLHKHYMQHTSQLAPTNAMPPSTRGDGASLEHQENSNELWREDQTRPTWTSIASWSSSR